MKISIVAHPNAKNPRVEKDLTGMLHIYVNKPPLKNKANEAIIELLTDFFKTKKGNIILLSGSKSKHKTFEIIK